MANSSIGKAYVQIVPTAKGITKDMTNLLDKGADKSGKESGNTFGKNMVSTIKKVVIGAGIAKVFMDSLNAGANLQQSFGGLETLYGDAAATAKEYAYEAAKAGISANDYAEQAVSFGASLKDAFGGDTTKAAEAANTAIMDMADNAAKMGTPIENIQNAYQGFAKQNYTMLDNLKLGYGGTKTEMERLLADAQKISGVEYNIDNLGDVYDAIHVIQTDLGLTGVAADEAATTFSGSFNAMKAAASNLMANLALGENVLPQMKILGQSVKTFIVGNLLPMIGNIVKQIPSIMAELPAFLEEIIPEVIPAMADMVASMAHGLIDNIPTFIAGLESLMSSAWDSLTNIDWSAAGQIMVSLLQTAWDGLGEIAQTIWDTVVGIFTGEIEFPDISEAAKTVWNALTTKASEVWTAVKTWFTKTFQFPSLVEMAKTAWNGLTTLASTIWTAIKTWFQKTFSFPSLTKLAYEAWSGLTTLASTIWESVLGFFSSAISIPSLDAAARTAWNTLSGIASTIWDGVASVFSSIDIEWPDFGEMAKGALEGLKTAAKNVWDWVKGLFSGDSDDEAVKSVQGSTSEMAATLADAELQISAVDVSSITEANEFVKQTVLGWMNIFGGMKNWMILPTPDTSSLQSTSQVIASWISTFKKQMSFTWSLPKPTGKLPNITATMKTAGSGNTSVSYPELSVSGWKWFAKGGIFNAPSVIGVGEAGTEAVVPLDKMWKQMDKNFDEHSNKGAAVYQTFNVSGAQDPDLWATSAARTLKRELRMG